MMRSIMMVASSVLVAVTVLAPIRVHAFSSCRQVGKSALRPSLFPFAVNSGSGSSSGSDLADADASSKDRNYGVNVREGSLAEALLETGKVPYGEKSRRYRRTVFDHSDWVEHRSSSSRILSNLQSMIFSGVVRQLRPQVGIVTAVAGLLLVWNTFLFPTLSLQYPALLNMPFFNLLMLPSVPFTLSSPALGLLLVFRTNASYARWMEARNNWARMVSHGRNLIRMADVYSDDEKALQSFYRAVWLYLRTAMNQLSSPKEDELPYRNAVEEVYRKSNDDDDDYDDSAIGRRIVSSPHRTMAAWKQLSNELHNLSVPDPKMIVETDKSIIILGECMAICEKIYSSPIPLVYTRHTARFLSLWALLLPAALYASFLEMGLEWAVLPASAVLAFFLFGVGELAMQLEEPFSILPMQSFCDQVLEASEIFASTGTDEG